jgi:hydroxylamine reductase (hybrid-cluster protein)
MQDKFHSFHPVATVLSYLTKAPLVSLFLLHSGITALHFAPIQPLIFSCKS